MIGELGLYFVYIHTRWDKNEVFYVGIGSKFYNKDFIGYRRAWEEQKRNKHWSNIISNTYFFYNIVLESDNYAEIQQKEIELIKKFGRVDLGTGSLVNLTAGGEGAKERIHTEETKEKIRKKHLGKLVSEETKIRNREARLGYSFGPESWAKTSETMSTPTDQFDLNGVFIQQFKSANAAAASVGIHGNNIRGCTRLTSYTAGGFIWRKGSKNIIPENIIIASKKHWKPKTKI